MAEFSPALLPALEQDVRLRGETKEEGEWILHVDGSSNIRGAGMGIVLTLPTGNTAVGTEIRTVDFRLNKETRKTLIS